MVQLLCQVFSMLGRRGSTPCLLFNYVRKGVERMSDRTHKHEEAVKSMSYSQKKRAKMADYREVYFSHNPGLFGCIWFCAYCKRVIIGKHNVEVDHVVPLNNPFGMNKGFNLVSSCRECNRNKSDKVDGRVAVGYSSKFLDFIVFSLQKVVIISFVAIWTVLRKAASLVVNAAIAPYRSGDFAIMVAATLLYLLIFYIVI